MMSGFCSLCDTFESGSVSPQDHEFYCDVCWDAYEEQKQVQDFRCYTFANVYDIETDQLMSCGSSVQNVCAERNALWKLRGDAMIRPKTMIVVRVRKNRKDTKQSLGTSKPCKQCILAMQCYNVVSVSYSNGATFKFEETMHMTTDYSTKSQVLLRM